MRFKSFLILTILSLFGRQVSAQDFTFSHHCTKAYQHIIALQIDSGRFYLEAEKIANPTNKLPLLLDNYIDFLQVYTSGSVNEYKTKKNVFDDRISALKEGSKTSPYYLYAQAEVHIQSAVLHIKFGEYVATIFDLKKALKKLEANQESFPSFKPNNKSLGMLYTILGSIPQQYQNTLDFIGLSGDVSKGMALLNKSVVDYGHPFQHEAATIYAFMLLHIQNQPSKAWEILKTHDFNAHNNLMDAYTLGHLGIHGNHCDAGIQALLSKPQSSAYLKFPLTNFLLGMGKTYRQDADANVYFQKFLDENKGEDYIKSAWHKMAWNELISGNTTNYDKYLKNAETYGRSVIDTDKQAQKEAESEATPNAILLKTRLLSDGNYLSRARSILEELNVNSFKSRFDKTEYFYRLARVYDKSKQLEKAKQYYEITIVNGKNVPFYYAANSAYLLGFLYEQELNNTEAINYYNLCLNLDGYEYENSIHQKAEAALNRLK